MKRNTIQAAVCARRGHWKELGRGGGGEAEKIPKEIMAESVTNLLKNNLPVQEAQ